MPKTDKEWAALAEVNPKFPVDDHTHELYFHRGMKPEDIFDPEHRKSYEAWLQEHHHEI